MRRIGPGRGGHRIVVVRHGPAELRDPARWPDDARRPLTDKGLRATRRAARGIAHLLEGDPRRIATSSAERARATADVLRGAIDSTRRPESWRELGSGLLAEPILDRLGRTLRPREGIFLVGHEPTLAEFVGLALAGEAVPLVRLSKGGAVCLEFPATIAAGAAHLLWALTRQQLEELGE